MATGAMDNLADKYAGRAVRSIFLYTREAHPGENYRHHRSMEDKRSNARAFQQQYKVRRPILLDNLQGDAHRAYGVLPNMTWIIGRGGIVHYKSAWTDAEHVESALIYALEAQQRKIKDGLTPFYSESLSWRHRDDRAFRAGLERTGQQAVDDFYGIQNDE
jgi:hypothetical protein